MLNEIPSRELPYKFYFDNLFTSLNLLNYLRENSYGGTGTLRENRLPKNFPLVDKKTMTKSNRGDYKSVIDKDHGIFFVRWTDNYVVM